MTIAQRSEYKLDQYHGSDLKTRGFEGHESKINLLKADPDKTETKKSPAKAQRGQG